MNCIIFANFADINNPHTITVEKALERIRLGKSKDKILEIRRKAFIGEDYDADKKDLPCVVFAAAKTKMLISKRDYETHREDACVVEHSGFFTLDFDKCDVDLKIDQLSNDPYIYAAWISPTGTGVRALVRCPASIESHNLYYTAFLDRYPDLDPTSRNISRVAFESYDPDIYINESSLVWDKRLTEDQRKTNKEKVANRRGSKIISTAVGMVRSSFDGNKHEKLRDAAVLLGGYIAAGRVVEADAIKVLEEEIKAKAPKDMAGARKTIQDGIAFGKSRPLIESKKIEKAQEYLRREDGSFEFLADDSEMDAYVKAVVNGTLEQGLPTGFNQLNSHWLFKKNHLTWMAALDNVGKSFLAWYLAVLAAKFHNWKVLINSAENNDGQIFKKLMEFYLNKSLKLADDEELTKAHSFVRSHFRIISSKQIHTMEEFLMKAELVYDEGWEYDLLIGEPMNSFAMESSANIYMVTMQSLNLLRVFKENYCSVMITDHIGTAAARKKDKDGFVEVPWKSDVSQGQIVAAKTDDFLILHRLVNHPYDNNKLQIHVTKIKDIETGGFPTKKDEPVVLEINKDYCGYTSNGQDPMKHKRI